MRRSCDLQMRPAISGCLHDRVDTSSESHREGIASIVSASETSLLKSQWRGFLVTWPRATLSGSSSQGFLMSVSSSDLAQLYPLDKLRPENLEQLAREAQIEEVAKGAVLFKAGGTDENTLFLLSGRVRGDYPEGKKKEIDASPLQGRYALGDLQPRRFTA